MPDWFVSRSENSIRVAIRCLSYKVNWAMIESRHDLTTLGDPEKEAA